MTVRFTWGSGEWREACLLCMAGEPSRNRALGGSWGMAHILLIVMAVAGIPNLLPLLRNPHLGILSETMLPLIALLMMVPVAVLFLLSMLRGRRDLRGLPPVPEGEQELIVHENGWHLGGAEAAQSMAVGMTTVEPWRALRSHSSGRQVLALLTGDGRPLGVPFRVLSREQGSWVRRLLERKLAVIR